MRSIFILLLLATLSCSGQNASDFNSMDLDSLLEAPAKAAMGKPFPAFSVSNEKMQISNESLKGKTVLINFWFEGCGPCIREFPALNELYDTLKANKNFMFISFTLDNAPTIERVKEKYRLKFPAFTVSQEEASRLNQHSGFPTSIVLDKSGKIRYMCGSGGTKANNAEKVREFVMTKLYAEITNAF